MGLKNFSIETGSFCIFFWLFVADVILLGWIGGCPVEDPYVLIGQLGALYYFAYFLVILPGLGLLERILLTHYLENNKA